MLKTIRNFPLFFLLLALVLACAPAGVATPFDPNSIQTAIAGTSAAAATQTAQLLMPLTGADSPTPTATRVPSMTPFPTFTAVVLGKFAPMVRVSKNTNCRSGPGEAYPKVGALRVGEMVEVVGRSKDAKYWIIINPNRRNSVCWLYGQYATITGLAGALPVMTPPPTPKPTRTPTRKPTATRPAPTAVPPSSVPPTAAPPSFSASYSNMERCPGTGFWADIELQNIGGVAFESIFVGMRDTVTDTIFSFNLENFTNIDCGASDTQLTLPPGTTSIVSAPIYPYDFTGNQMEIAITLCTEPSQTGTCLSQAFTFTPTP